MYDCIDLHNTISRADATWDRRARTKGLTFENSSQKTVSKDSGWFYTSNINVYDVVSHSLRGSVTADIGVPKFRFNPVTTAWELVPCSFVIDWFLDVGQSLAAASFLAIAKRYVASWGVKIEIVRNISHYVSDINRSMLTSVLHNQTAQAKATLLLRCPCNVPLTPNWQFKVDTAKVIDLLCLIKQRL